MAPQNIAAWVPEPGKTVEVRESEMPKAGEGQLVIQVSAVPAQPAEWKLQRGILKFPLTYPAIYGTIFAGTVYEVGPGVDRFKKGDRVTTVGAGSLRNHPHFGAYQKYALTTQDLTAKISNTPFPSAAGATSFYTPLNALVHEFNLDRPSATPNPSNRAKKILIWGASSTVGALGVQIALMAGYTVVGTASARNLPMVESYGAVAVDRKSPNAVDELVANGPYHRVWAAQDSAEDQALIGEVLAKQGGGEFISTMGVRPGVVLPEGVTGRFVQYLDYYLEPKNVELTRWAFWEWLEGVLRSGELKVPEGEVVGGLGELQGAWDMLAEGRVSGKRLIICPDME